MKRLTTKEERQALADRLLTRIRSLECSERAGAISSAQQETLDAFRLAREVLEAEPSVAAPEAAFKAAFNIWQDKTEWVQKDRRFDVLVPWGKHRADVLREYIERLEAQLGALAKQQPFAWTDNEEAEEMQNGTYGSMFNGDHIHEHQKRDGQWFPLYRQAVPPAPVLKLPGEVSCEGLDPQEADEARNLGQCEGWNRCLAEIKRLNEVKP